MEIEGVKIGGMYAHFKTGKLNKVIAVGKHSETLEPMVIYESQYDNPESKIWCRPLEMFLGEVDKDGKWVKRFALVE